MENKNTALTIMEGIDNQVMASSINKIRAFQGVIKHQFTEKHDYGIIPGTGNKPVLLKPGAEKICMLMGLSTEFNSIDSTRDFEKGFFQYQIKCRLLKNGEVITEGLGSANTKERKFIKQDPFSMDNTVLKMAKKRALVDAVLLVASLSDVFTQDIEDMTDIAGGVAGEKGQVFDDDSLISQAQAKRMFAVSGGNSELCTEAIGKYGYKSSKEVCKKDYDSIIKYIEDKKNGVPEAEEFTEEDIDRVFGNAV